MFGTPATIVLRRVIEPVDLQDIVRSLKAKGASLRATEQPIGFELGKDPKHIQKALRAGLRKFHALGAQASEDNGVQRLSDAELITQLANQAKELGIEIDLSYRLRGEQ
jgi:hypothetical protein